MTSDPITLDACGLEAAVRLANEAKADCDRAFKGFSALNAASYMQGRITALATALASLPKPVEARVREGWKLVPVEPTREMVAAWPVSNHGSGHERSIWAAMLAASPLPAQEPAQEPVADAAYDDAVTALKTLREARTAWLGDVADGMMPARKWAATFGPALMDALSAALASPQPHADGVKAAARARLEKLFDDACAAATSRAEAHRLLVLKEAALSPKEHG